MSAPLCRAQSPPYFNVRDANYGAVGDGVTLDSPAINQAIAAAGAAGGGTVVFPPGTYLCGSLHLTNNLTLYLSNNAVIWGSAANVDTHESSSFSSYQDQGHSYFHDALIWGWGLTNIGIMGPGKIDGHGALTTGNPSSSNPGDKALSLVLCTNITLTDITITNGGHFGILFQACQNMLMNHVNILEKTSRDGINVVDTSYVTITNCLIEGSDDSCCLKSDYALGRKVGEHNVHVSHCTILSTQNNATQIGSETVGNFSDITFSDLVLTGAGKAGIGITSQDGAIEDGLTYDNITMSNCACPIFLKLDYRTTDSPTPSVGRIRNVSINNVTAYHSTLDGRTNTSTINGYFDTSTLVGTPIENITFNNVIVSHIGKRAATGLTNYPPENQDWQPQNFGVWPSYGWYLRFARNISFTNCQATFDNNDDRPAVVVDQSTNILFQGFIADVGNNNTNYDMGFRTGSTSFEVTNAVASANAPSPGSNLRVQTTNGFPALVVLPPYFAPGDGVYNGVQNVTIASGTPDATISYTTDGTTPTSSNGIIYSGPIAIGAETVLRAVAYTNGFVDSAVNTAIYQISSGTPTAAAPTFNPTGGTYASTQLVSIASSTAGASIRYTTDGSTPTSMTGTIYSGPVAITSNTVLNAIAYTNGFVNSSVSGASYTITGVAGTPVFTPAPGTYANSQSVTMSSPTPDASIYYTTNGSDPSVNGTLYSGPILIISPATFEAIATAPGASSSAIATGSYSIVSPQLALTFEAELIPFVAVGAPAVVQNDVNSSDGQWMALEATTNGPYIEFSLTNVPAGIYQLSLKWKGNTSNRGIITHTVDGTALNDALDLYSSTQTYPETNLGTFTFTNGGNHTVRQTVIGKGPQGTGDRWTSADKFTLTLLQSMPSVIASLLPQSNGTVQLNGVGYPSLGYSVQAETNLTSGSWVTIGHITADSSGNLFFTDTNAPSLPTRYYRFVTP
jgi:hypothetical protein